LFTDPLEAATGADALVIMTPWKTYGAIGATELKGRLDGVLVVDPYAILDRQACLAAGLDHRCLGC
jgi:UDPglucose 6-dehydrogenase